MRALLLRPIAASMLATSLPRCAAATMATRPASIKLYYGDIPFWRAEVVRLGLFIGDVPFEDIRDKKRDELIAAGLATFGAVPVMEVDGKVLSQTQAMAAYAGKVAGIHPDEAATYRPMIDALDARLLATEVRDLCAESEKPGAWGKLAEPLKTRIKPWGPDKAAEEFAARLALYGIDGRGAG